MRCKFIAEESDGRTAYFFEASKTVIAAWRALILRRAAMPKPSARSVNDCFKKWAPDFEMTEYCFRNQSIAYRQL
jgi:hypothetical protein